MDWIDEIDNEEDYQTFYEQLKKGIYNSRLGWNYWRDRIIYMVEDDARDVHEVRVPSKKMINEHIKKISE